MWLAVFTIVAMAYDEELAGRIRQLIGSNPELTENKMFGGLAWRRRRASRPSGTPHMSAAQPQTGLVPFLLEGIDPMTRAAPGGPGMRESSTISPLEPLEEGQGEDPADILVRLPFSRRFPGLTPPKPRRGIQAAPVRVALVPAVGADRASGR